MMFGRRKRRDASPYDKTGKFSVIRSSICTGEQVAGFKNAVSGKFEELMLIRDGKDLSEFLHRYQVEDCEIKQENERMYLYLMMFSKYSIYINIIFPQSVQVQYTKGCSLFSGNNHIPYHAEIQHDSVMLLPCQNLFYNLHNSMLTKSVFLKTATIRAPGLI